MNNITKNTQYRIFPIPVPPCSPRAKVRSKMNQNEDFRTENQCNFTVCKHGNPPSTPQSSCYVCKWEGSAVKTQPLGLGSWAKRRTTSQAPRPLRCGQEVWASGAPLPHPHFLCHRLKSPSYPTKGTPLSQCFYDSKSHTRCRGGELQDGPGFGMPLHWEMTGFRGWWRCWADSLMAQLVNVISIV